MDASLLTDLAEPRFENGKPMLIAGIGARYTIGAIAAIPAQWMRFGAHMGHVPGQVGGIAYGVCCNFDGEGSFEYIAGVEVANFSQVLAGFTALRIPAQTYAVFSHTAHISEMRRTLYTIWNKWMPESGKTPEDAPHFERYGPEFNPMTGMGLVEIWVPVKG